MIHTGPAPRRPARGASGYLRPRFVPPPRVAPAPRIAPATLVALVTLGVAPPAFTAPPLRATPPSREPTPPAEPARPGAQRPDPWSEGNPPPPPATSRLPDPSAAPGVKRPRPDYDGRAPAHLTAGDVLIWIPRALFYPLYLTLEYVIRWPISSLLSLLEEHHLIEKAKRFFLFHDNRGLILPTLLQDLGKYRAVGLYFRYRDLGIKGHTLQSQVGFWSNEWVEIDLEDRLSPFGPNRGRLVSEFHFRWRPDNVFHGLGYDSEQAARSFYRITETDLALGVRAPLAGLSRFRTKLRYRTVKIERGQAPFIDDPDRAEYWDVSTLAGFGDHYHLLSATGELFLDSRNPNREVTPGTGVRLSVFGSFSLDPGDTELHFANWGAELALFLDVTERNHVLGLRLYLEAQETTGRRAVPIHHRVTLGGNERLRGFVRGRYRGDSAFLLSLQYRYPIWWMLDASLFASVGNVFTGRFADFAYERLVASWGLGLRTNNSREVSFDILIAFGSNLIGRWARHFELQHVRLVIGVSREF